VKPSDAATVVTPCEEPLAEAVRRLVDALQPERIYLFGSRARGDATEDSDYDLMVVVPDTEEPRHSLVRTAYDALWGVGISKDILVWTHPQFERQAPVVASLPATILREGRLLYAAPNINVRANNRITESVEGTGYSSPDDEKLQLLREWMVKGDRDLQTAEHVLASLQLPDIVVFHCQQAAEKALKGYLAWRDVPSRKIHELEEILADCQRMDADFRALTVAAQTLSPYAVDPRYPSMTPSPSLADAASALRSAREVVQFVSERVPPEAAT
jgi:HEPN domain-containing protein